MRLVRKPPGIILILITSGLLLAACSPQTATTPATLLPTSVPPTDTPLPTPTTAVPATVTPIETEAIVEEPPLPTPTEPPIIESVTSLPNPAVFEWRLVADGINRPTDLADPYDGSGRLLVLSQIGRILVIENGQIMNEPFLDLVDQVGATANERGLLGIALDPDYAENGIFYLNYSDNEGSNIISRFRRADDVYRADPASEQVLLVIEQPYGNHNGGDLEFGPDGLLYIGMGDGGSGGDPQRNAQNINTLLGKMLRIDVRGKETYTIPADNPYASGGGRQEIWASGLRNPWRYTFDRLTGDLYIADVGQNQWEEINFVPAGSPPGLNFGWHFREGTHAFAGSPPRDTELYDPVYEYGRSDGCSVTGGYVYRGNLLPELYGVYLFGDYCTGSVWGMLRDGSGDWQVQRLFQLPVSISSFGEDASGELYLLDHRNGGVYRLERR
jgi:glucose/arabinose dehydrogenase